MVFVTAKSENPIGQRQSDASSPGSFLPANPPVGGDWKEMELSYDARSEQRNV
ncbi:MAG: hypothetical protein WAV28_09005 [Sedimentisphaerales bacterium]